MENENLTPKPFIRDTDYHRLLQVRSVEPAEEKKEEMILEGRAVVFNEEIELFSFVDFDGERVIVKESIDEHALDKTDFDGCFLKFNHSDQVFPLARCKNGTLEISIKEDGAYIRAKLADIQASRDLYTLVKEGIIDKMSFAFTIKEEERVETVTTDDDGITTRTIVYRVKEIDKMYDVAAVNNPAYDNTSISVARMEDVPQIYARRKGDVESRISEVETELKQKKEQEAKELLEREKSEALQIVENMLNGGNPDE